MVSCWTVAIAAELTVEGVAFVLNLHDMFLPQSVREGLVMLSVRFSMARHSAEETVIAASQSAKKSDAAVKECCTLHGRLAATLWLRTQVRHQRDDATAV